jgi:fatty-acyl-CoA synthase
MTIPSYAKGPAGRISEDPIGRTFLNTAARHPDRLAFVSRHQDLRWTWSQYRDTVLRVAAGLKALDLQPGDRIGVWSTNCAEWAALQFGAAVAGIVLVNVNPAYRSHELKFVLAKSRMKALFLHARDTRTDFDGILAASQPVSSLPHVIHFDTPEWDAFLRPPLDLVTDPAATEPANIQYTSGTTGQPKGVVLTHRNIVNNGAFIAEYMRLTEADSICLPVPLFHCFGCVIGTVAAACTGAAVVLPSAAFSAPAVLQAIDAERCTAIYGVPTMFIAELNDTDFHTYNLTSLRTGVMAGAPCPVEVMRRVVGDMHCTELVVCYGQTESAPVITMSRADDTVEIRCTTVGCALPETEVRIASPEGETVETGRQGELLTRGCMVMQCYDDEPEATRAAIDSEGWLHTGDLAVMRPDGYFRITGRAKDVIIRGGENISPREIEEFLYTHPAVSDVHIVGVPDEKLGETVASWVRLKPGAAMTEAEVRDYCRGELAHFKVPQYVRFVDDFPMTLSGKIQKFKMREFEIRERHLETAARQETA